MNSRSVYYAYVTAIAVVFLGLGLFGFTRHDPEGGLPAGSVIQQGHVIEGGIVYDHFNQDVKLDTSQVSK